MTDRDRRNAELDGWWALLLVLVCIATCDECSSCRENARSLRREVQCGESQ